MPFASIRNLALIVRRIEYDLEDGADGEDDDIDGPFSVTMMKWGLINPTWNFLQALLIKY